MFFGLEVKSNSSKPIILENTTKLSQAVLEPSKNGKREPVSLIAEYNKRQFILCVLDPTLSWQCPLDLLFEGGAEVKFLLRGSGTVHLTGYEPLDDYDDMNYSISSVSSSEDEDMQLTPSKSKLALLNGSTSAKKSPKQSNSGKKSKHIPMIGQEDDDTDDSDDEDFELVKQGLESSSDEVSCSDEDGSFDEDDDDDDEDDDDDDDDDEDNCQIEEMSEDSD